MSKKLQIAIVGVGGRGYHFWQLHKPQDGCEVTVFADPSDKAAGRFSDKLPDAKRCHDLDELLRMPEIDAVCIMTPDFMHEEQAVAALLAGKAVYLEKPMAITIDGCDRILRAAYRSGSKLFVGHNMRYFPVVLKMKELIDSGAIGDVRSCWCRHFVAYGGNAYFKDWHSERCNTTGLLLQKGAHDIDVIHYLLGSYSEAVSGMGMLGVYGGCPRRPAGTAGRPDGVNFPPADGIYAPNIDVEDHNMVMMQLSNGCQAAYLQCHFTPDAERNYTVIGTKGRLENIGDMGNCSIHLWQTHSDRQHPDVIYQLKESSGTHGGSDPAIMRSFIDFLRDLHAPNPSPVAARNAVAVGFLAHCSMRGGGERLTLPPLPADLEGYFKNGQKR